MVRKDKIKSFFIVFLFVVFNMFLSFDVQAVQDKNILIIASYTSYDSWETSIVNGLKDKIGNHNDIKVEFLDSRSPSFSSDYQSFMDYLDSKYANENIDYIITLDDEALYFARANLYNESSFFYKKNIIFAGVNDVIDLSEEEKHYISGLYNNNNYSDLFNIILRQNKKVKNIYLITNDNIYGNSIIHDYYENLNSFDRPFNLKIISGTSFEEIKEAISNISFENNSAIYLSGTFKKDLNGLTDEMSADEIVSSIKQLTTAPIYTTIMDYIDAGAVGGIVNNGYKIGITLSSIIKIEESNILDASLDNTFDTPYFNFKEIRKYSLDPWVLPSNTTYINKKSYNIIAPKKYILLLYLFFGLILFIITYITLELIKKRKEYKEKSRLLIESLEREKITTDFVVSLSHELRTPLNIIKNGASIIKLKIQDDNISKEYSVEKLDNIIKNSNRLQRYINNLIDVSRFESNQILLDSSSENIVQIVEDTVLSIIDLGKNHNIEIIFDTSDEEIIMDVDISKLQRIILNLLSNSIKFSKDEGTIFVNIEKIDDYVVIAIKDNGLGIPEGSLPHIFDKFKRNDNDKELARHHEGSGLGLYIVKNLVTLMDGEIKIKSTLNVGTEVTIILPIKNTCNKDSKQALCESLTHLEMSDIDNHK